MPRLPSSSLVDCVSVEALGVGVTQRAKLPSGDTPVRVRRLPPGRPVPEDAMRRFLNTCAQLEVLRGDTLDQLLAYDGAPEPYVATETVDAVSLGEILASTPGGLEPEAVAAIGEAAARGLAAAHSMTPPVAHRAFDLEAVLVTHDGRARVTGFAFGALAHDAAATVPSVKKEIGEYRAPEQLRTGQAGPAADMFALGAVLYESIAGIPPFAADNPTQARIKVEAGSFEPIDALRPSAPSSLVELIHGMLRLDPGHRPTATQVAGTLAMMTGPGGGREALNALVRTARVPDARRTTAQGADVVSYARSLLQGAQVPVPTPRVEPPASVPQAAPAAAAQHTPAPVPHAQPYTPAPVPQHAQPQTPAPVPHHAQPYTPAPVPHHAPAPVPQQHTPAPVRQQYTPAPVRQQYTPAPVPQQAQPYAPAPQHAPPSVDASGEVPRTVVMGYPERPADREDPDPRRRTERMAATPYTPPSDEIALPSPSPSSGSVALPSPPRRTKTRPSRGGSRWLLWLGVAFVAFAVMGLVVGGAIYIAS